MKRLFTLLFFACSCPAAIAQIFPVVDLRISGRKDNRINLVILPDGYTAAQQTTFVQNADTIRKNAFKYTPLKEYINFYNAYCIKVPSVETGVNHPGTATDVVEPADPVTVVNNYFGSIFDNGGVHRALVVGKTAKVASVLASNLPDYDLAFVLSNTTIYGGTGGEYATGTMHPASVKVAVHEWGHSFAGLADEYWAGIGFAAEKPNMTANNDPTTIKWKDWIGIKKVGIYAYGTDVDSKKWFRPHQDCMMQYLDTVLCPVCKQTFVDRIYSLVTPIDVTLPDTALTVPYTTTPLLFTTTLIKPIPNTLVVQWTLNGSAISFTDSFASITGSMLTTGINELKILVTDTTSLSKTYKPAAGYQFSAKWKINKTGTGIINIAAPQNSDKFFYKLYPIPAHSQAVFEYENFGATSVAQCQLVDINGRIIKNHAVEITAGKNAIQLDLQGMSPGIYFVQLKSESIQVNTKLIIE